MLIKMKDYERIYQVINSIIKNDGKDPSTSCMFFSACGARILREYYNLDAIPKAGLAAFHFGVNDIIVFGEENNGRISGEGESFHCWIEVNGWVVDFMVPAFPQLYSSVETSIPSKMFQKPLTEMSSSLLGLKKAGHFYLESTQETTIKHMHEVYTIPLYRDLEDICVQWFKKPPKKIKKIPLVSDGRGNQSAAKLIGETIRAKW